MHYECVLRRPLACPWPLDERRATSRLAGPPASATVKFLHNRASA